MKRYLADVTEAAMELLCVLSGHAGGCWLLNQSPLRRLYWWAVNTLHPERMAMRRQVVPDVPATLTTTNTAGSGSVAYVQWSQPQ